MKKLILALTAAFAGFTLWAQPQMNMKSTALSNTEFAEMISDPQVQIVDVRTPGEYTDGHIEEAVNMDVQSFGFEAKTATLDKQRPVAVYCRSGARSRLAAKKLSEMGFKVYDLAGGVTQWTGRLVK